MWWVSKQAPTIEENNVIQYTNKQQTMKTTRYIYDLSQLNVKTLSWRKTAG